MKVGIAVNFASATGQPDVGIVRQQFELMGAAEDLGFDGLMVLEHHFTGYSMSPAPLQTLAYAAGRTKSLVLASGVVALPWNDPIRVAEQMMLLDIMCDERCLFGVGRGGARVEYEGFSVPIDESSSRFAEALDVILGLLGAASYAHDGEHYKLPELSIRPWRPNDIASRMFGAARSVSTLQVLASRGLGLLVAADDSIDETLALTGTYAQLSGTRDMRRPIGIARSVACLDGRRARDLADHASARDRDARNEHYGLVAAHTSGSHDRSGGDLEACKDSSSVTASSGLANSPTTCEVVGSPDECLATLSRIRATLNPEFLFLEFSFGGLPHSEVMNSMAIFADRVLPRLRADFDQSSIRQTAKMSTGGVR